MQKVTIGFVMSVSPTVCQRGTIRLPQGGFSWNLRFEYFQKSVKKIQVSLKSCKDNRYLHEDMYFWSNLAHFLEWEMFHTKVVEEMKTFHLHFFFVFGKPAVSEIMWKNIVELYRPQMTIWCLCIACWIPKATNTYSEYQNTFCFPLQQWLCNCTSLVHYTYVACLAVTEVESVYCVVWTQSLNKTDYVVLLF
jgi:hypothetical protein